MTDLPAMPPEQRVHLPGGGWINLHEQPGEGPPILLLHGFTDCAHSYRLLLPFLVGRHVVVPDLRGHGASFRGPIRGFDDFCLDIEAVAREMGLTAPILVGHSMGSLVAVRLAARGILSTAALITLAGSLVPASAALKAVAQDIAALPHPLTVNHPFFDAWQACQRPVPDAFLSPLRSACAAMRPEDWISCLDLLQTTDFREMAQSVAVDSLVIGGSDDPLFPENHQATLSRFLPNSRGITLAGVGHNPHWEVPGLVAEKILGFLQG